MTAVDIIIKIGAVVAAIAGIIAFIKMIAVPITKTIKKAQEMLSENEKHNYENYVNILQLKIMSPYMPLEERVRAGYIYTEQLHENGPVHLQYELLQDEYKEKYGSRYKEPK